jgi:hypothetical protein
MEISRPRSARKLGLVLASAVAAAAALAACSSDPAAPGTPSAGAGGGSASGSTGAGAGGTSAGAGGAVSAGTGGTSAGAGVGGTGGASAGAAGSAGASGGAGGAAGSAGAAGGGTAGGGMGVTPQCLTNDTAFGVTMATTKYIECDVETQAIEFDVAANFSVTPGKGPGYDPTKTPSSFTNYGTAFTGWAVQECHPYCWKGNLTVGVSFVPGSDAGSRGEVLIDFPTTVNIANAVGRNSLGWIWLDGPALPAGSTLKAEMVLKSSTKGLLVAKNGSLTVTPKKWFEFKYFPIQNGFDAADLVNITSIGFRVTLSPNATSAWSGVIYADHFQLRQ